MQDQPKIEILLEEVHPTESLGFAYSGRGAPNMLRVSMVLLAAVIWY
jgi:hypothetical protein